MSVQPRLDDQRVWTVVDLDEIYAGDADNDVDWRRFEIVDGALVVSPPPVPRHEFVVAELIRALTSSVPAGHQVIGAVGIAMGRSFRVTDVTVVADRVFDQDHGLVRPDDVLLVIEIESPSSVTTDRVIKPAQYAAVGVPFYWRVETNPLRLNVYELVDGAYRVVGSWADGEVARLARPFPVEVEVRRLFPPPKRLG